MLVADNGIGIAAEDQERIFAPFVRLHGVEEYAGLGLGLSTVRKVVDMMGGQLGVESTPGNGTTFWIELAATEA
jgi:signal transduction histidine kinase